MRTKRQLLVAFVAFLVLGLFAIYVEAAGGTTEDAVVIKKATPGTGTITGSGTYSVEAGRTLVSLKISAYNVKTGQISLIDGKPDGKGNWGDAVLSLVPGTYDVSAILNTKDKDGIIKVTPGNDITGVKVP
jgi:hypothetical protein